MPGLQSSEDSSITTTGEEPATAEIHSEHWLDCFQAIVGCLIEMGDEELDMVGDYIRLMRTWQTDKIESVVSSSFTLTPPAQPSPNSGASAITLTRSHMGETADRLLRRLIYPDAPPVRIRRNPG